MAKKRILLVEDDKALANLMKIRLEDSNYETLIAYDGEEALKIARREKPDLIIMDVFLPGKDGFTAMKELKSASGGQETREIPVIVMTGRAPMMEDMFRIEGAAAFFRKPFDDKTLVAKIRELIGESES